MDLNFHGTDDQIEGYLLGRMSDLDIPVLEEHLTLCSTCRDRLDTMENLVLGMREVLVNEPSPASPVPLQKGWFGWLRRPAFAIAVAAIAVFTLAAALGVFSTGRAKFVPVATLALTAIRGDIPVAEPARELDLTLSDAPEGGPFRVEVVDATGGALWDAVAPGGPAGVQVKAKKEFGPGQYFVRLYSASGQLLREYGFRIRAA